MRLAAALLFARAPVFARGTAKVGGAGPGGATLMRGWTAVLVGKDTGYEGKFDFRRRVAAPDIPYMLASLPRSGSTWFSHLLWRTGCLGAPLEYLNFEAAGPYYFAASSPDVQRQLWECLAHRRTSANGVFGVK